VESAYSLTVPLSLPFTWVDMENTFLVMWELPPALYNPEDSGRIKSAPGSRGAARAASRRGPGLLPAGPSRPPGAPLPGNGNVHPSSCISVNN
jgi:hypothetical protein